MSVDRRRFMAGCSSVGLLAATPAVAMARGLEALAAPAATAATAAHTAEAAGAATDRPLLLLRSDDDSRFAEGALRAARRAGLAKIDSLEFSPARLRSPGALRTALEARRGAVVLGLLDDCSHTLLEECLRDLGGSLLCRGQHFGSPGRLADSRHLFTTTPASRGIGGLLARTLASGRDAFLVREQSTAGVIGAATGDATVDAAASAAEDGARLDPHWAAALGIAYVRMAAGQWRSSPLRAQAQRGSVSPAPDSQPLVSLLATV